MNHKRVLNIPKAQSVIGRWQSQEKASEHLASGVLHERNTLARELCVVVSHCLVAHVLFPASQPHQDSLTKPGQMLFDALILIVQLSVLYVTVMGHLEPGEKLAKKMLNLLIEQRRFNQCLPSVL